MGLYARFTCILGKSGEVVSADGCEKVEGWSSVGYILDTPSPCPDDLGKKDKKKQRRIQLMLVFVCSHVVRESYGR